MCEARLLLSSKVYRTAFWMRAFGHTSDKRTKVWSNSFAVALLQMAKPLKRKGRRGKKKVALAIKYQDKSGRTRYKGSPQLKSSQSFGCTLNGGLLSAIFISSLFLLCCFLLLPVVFSFPPTPLSVSLRLSAHLCPFFLPLSLSIPFYLFLSPSLFLFPSLSPSLWPSLAF